MPELQRPHLSPSQPGRPRGLCAQGEAGYGQLGPGGPGPPSGENALSLGSPHLLPEPHWVSGPIPWQPGDPWDPHCRLSKWRAQSWGLSAPQTSPQTGPASAVSGGLCTSHWGAWQPVLLADHPLPAPLATDPPRTEEVDSVSAAQAFYSQPPPPRPPASPSRPEPHTVIHVGSLELAAHGELGSTTSRPSVVGQFAWREPGDPERHFLTSGTDLTEVLGQGFPPLPQPLRACLPDAVPAGHPNLQLPGRYMTLGMITRHQASIGTVMMTSTVADRPWAGWPSCSGTLGGQ